MTEKELAEHDRSDIAAVFSTREGRRFFARLIHECGVYSLSYDGTPQETAFLEGRRSIGLLALSWLNNADENAVVKVFEADKERSITNGRSRAKRS